MSQIQLNNRKLSLVRIHETFQISGVTDLANPLVSKGDLQLDMTKVEGGVHIIASKAGKTGECFIPDSNCKGVVFFPKIAS